jgi:hypothetical protein
MAHTAPIRLDIPGLEALTADLHRLTDAIQADDNTTAGIAVRAIQLMREAGEQRDRNAAERDGAYRERAQLLAWLAALHPAVIAPAPDVTEPGWQILYLSPLAGGQMSWHIAPRDSDLFAHVEHVPAGDPRAQWDGHTTEAKYQRIAALTRLLTDNADSTGEAMCLCTVATRCAVCRAEDAVVTTERRLTDALGVIHEWQRNGEPNEYLTRVHRALAPPTSGTSTAKEGSR